MCRALIVEDDTAFRHMLREILRARFPAMSIEEDRDGSELFPKINAFRPNIVLMDISLPRKNGLALTKEIKTNYPDIIVVTLASCDLPEYRQAATQYKADYFISRDSLTQDFLALVESILPWQKSDPNR